MTPALKRVYNFFEKTPNQNFTSDEVINGLKFDPISKFAIIDAIYELVRLGYVQPSGAVWYRFNRPLIKKKIKIKFNVTGNYI